MCDAMAQDCRSSGSSWEGLKQRREPSPRTKEAFRALMRFPSMLSLSLSLSFRLRLKVITSQRPSRRNGVGENLKEKEEKKARKERRKKEKGERAREREKETFRWIADRITSSQAELRLRERTVG